MTYVGTNASMTNSQKSEAVPTANAQAKNTINSVGLLSRATWLPK